MSLPEDYLPNDEPDQGIIPIRARAANTTALEPFTGSAKYVGQFARGVSLGTLGDPTPPSGLAQTVTEMAGTLLPYQGLSMLAAPLVGGLAGTRALQGLQPILRKYPVIQGAAADAAAGGIGGAIHAKATGGDVLTESLEGAGLNAAARLAWGLWARRNPNPTPAQAAQAVAARAAGQMPPTPPGLSPAIPAPMGPGTPLPVVVAPHIYVGRPPTRPGVPPTEPAPQVIPDTGTLPGGNVPRVGPEPAPGPIVPVAERGALFEIADRVAAGPAPTGLDAPLPGAAQAELFSRGAIPPSQLNLPMTIVPTGRINRYTTPTRYKGSFPTAELASLESDAIAQRAMEEGVQTVRVTTSVVPTTGNRPQGGVIRVYQSEGGRPVLVSETRINDSAVKTASVGASPMRRVNPDWFDVKWDERLGSDVLIPRTPTVEAALDMTSRIDPAQTTFPLSPTQTSWLASHEGRAIRQKLDIRSRHLTVDDVVGMSEEEAKRALIDTDKAPPMKTVGIVEPGPEAMAAKAVLTDLGVTEADLADFLQKIPFNLAPPTKAKMLTDWLQSKCAPGPTGPVGGP